MGRTYNRKPKPVPIKPDGWKLTCPNGHEFLPNYPDIMVKDANFRATKLETHIIFKCPTCKVQGKI